MRRARPSRASSAAERGAVNRGSANVPGDDAAAGGLRVAGDPRGDPAVGHRIPAARAGPDRLCRGRRPRREAPERRISPPPPRGVVAVRRVALACLLVLAVWAPPAAAALPGAHIAAAQVLPEVSYPGLQHLHYEFGPLSIAPGQNSIQTEVDTARPQVPG